MNNIVRLLTEAQKTPRQCCKAERLKLCVYKFYSCVNLKIIFLEQPMHKIFLSLQGPH